MNRFTNLALGLLLLVGIIAGLVGQATGTPWARVPVVLHGVAMLGLVILAPWKRPIASRGLARRGAGAVWSVALVVLAILALGTGLAQMSGLVRRIGPLTVMQIHIGSGVTVVLLAAAHYVRHPVRPKRADLSRRTFVRSLGVGVGAGLAWLGWEGAVRLARWPGAARRYTGSHERGSGDPTAMPVTQWMSDRVPEPPAGAATVTIHGVETEVDDLAAAGMEEVEAVLDCTSGWYARQVWRGARLDRVMDVTKAASIEVRSVTGYSRRFPASDANKLWLAVEVGGAPLSRGHGYPVRLVAPGRRGFWWVKWVAAVEPSDVPWWFQLPFPLR